METQINGIAASDGVGIAPAYLLTKPNLNFEKYHISDPNSEKARLQAVMFDSSAGNKLNGKIAGQSPYTIAGWAGIKIPESTKVIVVKEDGVGDEHPFSKEKLILKLGKSNLNSLGAALGSPFFKESSL